MISPKEAFDAVKVLRPGITAIRRTNPKDDSVLLQPEGCCRIDVDIDWGDLTQYPPPGPTWRPATKDDAVLAIINGGMPARFLDNVGSINWVYGTLIGYVGAKKPRWVTEYCNSYLYCEVLDT